MAGVYLLRRLTRESRPKDDPMGKPSSQLLRVSQVMQIERERRDSKRAPCRLVCLFELTKFVDKSTRPLHCGVNVVTLHCR